MPDFRDRLAEELERAALAARDSVPARPGSGSGDFIDRLGGQLATAAAGEAPARPRGRRRIRPGRRALALGLATALIAAGGVAVATEVRFQSGPAPPEPGAPLANGPDRVAAAQLGILRRGVGAADEIPPSATVEFSGASGANPALARRARGLEGGRAWVVPGRGHICLQAEWPASHAGGASCGMDADIATGGIRFSSYVTGARAAEFIAGIVPDGVTRVEVALVDGRRLSVPVSENTYVAELPAMGRSVSFATRGRTITLGEIAIPRPPAS